VSCGVDHRRGSDPTLLWLWGRPVATALITPLAWEPPYAEGAALEKAQRQKKKKKKKKRKIKWGIPVMAQWLTNPTSIHGDEDQSLGSLSALRIQCCHELWCRS